MKRKRWFYVFSLVAALFLVTGCDDDGDGGSGDDGLDSSTFLTGTWSITISFDNLTYDPPEGFTIEGSIETTGKISQDGNELSGIVDGTKDGERVDFIITIPGGINESWDIRCVGTYDGSRMQGSWAGIYPNGVSLSNGSWSGDRQ